MRFGAARYLGTTCNQVMMAVALIAKSSDAPLPINAGTVFEPPGSHLASDDQNFVRPAAPDVHVFVESTPYRRVPFIT